MNAKNKRITVNDVARLAGVSKGTVDRVMHERGEVSEKSRQRVMAAIRQLGYHPNPYASLLASKKRYTILCLIPQTRSGEYWELVTNGINRAIEYSSDYNTEIDTVNYNQFDHDSFKAACTEVLVRNPDGVVLAPMFRDDTLALTVELHARNIPFVFIDSRLEGSDYLAYFGMPMFRSGYLGASLLTDGDPIPEIANFRIERGASPLDNPTLGRREGFLEYLRLFSPATTVYNEFIRPYETGHNEQVLDAFFEKHPDIRHIITFNSRVHLISEYLEKRGLRDMKLVGYDMLSRNIEGLRKGFVRFLIAQRTETQVFRGITSLIDLLAFHRKPEKRDNYMSMDILTRENVEYYSDI